MKLIRIEEANNKYSNVYFATKLVTTEEWWPRYKSEVLLKSVSENNTNQQVDLKSILGVSALLANKAAYLEIELKGEAEDIEFEKLTSFFNSL